MADYELLAHRVSDPGHAKNDFDAALHPEQSTIEICHIANNEMEIMFDIIGFSAPVVNAMRRTLLADVPTVAIEKVLIGDNTSVIPDEMIAHRLGLLPLNIDPLCLSFKSSPDEESTVDNSVAFLLDTKDCHKTVKQEHEVDEDNGDSTVVVRTADFKWIPHVEKPHSMLTKEHKKKFGRKIPAPVCGEILVAKLRSGQCLEVRAEACKGIGHDHAKFSPVSTAYYKLLPTVTLLKEVTGPNAELLQKCFAKGVIEIETKGNKEVAVVGNARAETGTRNVERYPELTGCCSVGRKRNHYMFTVESTGALSSAELVKLALKVMKAKCQVLLSAIENVDTTV